MCRGGRGFCRTLYCEDAFGKVALCGSFCRRFYSQNAFGVVALFGDFSVHLLSLLPLPSPFIHPSLCLELLYWSFGLPLPPIHPSLCPELLYWSFSLPSLQYSQGLLVHRLLDIGFLVHFKQESESRFIKARSISPLVQKFFCMAWIFFTSFFVHKYLELICFHDKKSSWERPKGDPGCVPKEFVFGQSFNEV